MKAREFWIRDTDLNENAPYLPRYNAYADSNVSGGNIIHVIEAAPCLAMIAKLEAALKSVNADMKHFLYCSKRYIEAGQDKQDVTKIGTPVRVAEKKINEALAELNLWRDGK